MTDVMCHDPGMDPSATSFAQALRGVLVVAQTPFTADDALDHDAHRAQMDWLFAHGAHGIVIGMVSEVLRLTAAERDELTALTIEAVAGRGPVVASVGAEATRIAVGHARAAQDAGASALMAAPPMLTVLPEDTLREYYAAIVEAVDLPVIVQDASGYVGKPLSVAFQAGLWHRYGDRVQFKPEADPIGPQLTQLLEATGGGARIFDGTGGLHLVEAHRRGVVGTMPSGDLVWALRAVWDALEAGDAERADELAGPLTQIVALQTSLDSFVAIEKHLLVRQGVLPSAALRAPAAPGIDEVTWAEVERHADQLRALVDAAGKSAEGAA